MPPKQIVSCPKRAPNVLLLFLGVAQNETGGGKPQVLVHVSTQQGSILVPVFGATAKCPPKGVLTPQASPKRCFAFAFLMPPNEVSGLHSLFGSGPFYWYLNSLANPLVRK